MAEVSPRLVSEVERNGRPHVSLATVLRLLALVGVAVTLHPEAGDDDEVVARRARAEHRRRHWAGWQGTLATQEDPPAPAAPADRLRAVAVASRLAVALQEAPAVARAARLSRRGSRLAP